MLRQIFFVLCLSIFALPLTAQSAQDTDAKAPVTSEFNSAVETSPLTTAEQTDDDWFLLSCVHSAHDCEHQAHNLGYHHHRTGYSHHCDHHDVGCFVRN